LAYPDKKPIDYFLEIFAPESVEEALVTFASDQPFQSYHKGDLISPKVWANNSYPNFVLQVSNVEHMISYAEGGTRIQDKLCVYTTLIFDIEEVRVSNQIGD
jgi:hypothetical protein